MSSLAERPLRSSTLGPEPGCRRGLPGRAAPNPGCRGSTRGAPWSCQPEPPEVPRSPLPTLTSTAPPANTHTHSHRQQSDRPHGRPDFQTQRAHPRPPPGHFRPVGLTQAVLDHWARPPANQRSLSASGVLAGGTGRVPLPGRDLVWFPPIGTPGPSRRVTAAAWALVGASARETSGKEPGLSVLQARLLVSRLRFREMTLNEQNPSAVRTPAKPRGQCRHPQ